MKTNFKCYSELSKLQTFEDRFNYLRLNGIVGKDTFGAERYLNQYFYKQVPEWKSVRSKIIVRDMGCDMGLQGYDIIGEKIIVHHMNPITMDDILQRRLDKLLNPETLVCVKLSTHNAIHYGNESYLMLNQIIERKPNDTCPWK